jgi:cytochrome c biogenesis protein CcdA
LNIDSVVQWLMAPLSGASTHTIDGWVVWHARLMVVAWAVLLPLGVIAARFFKITQRQNWPQQLDNRAWWHAHRSLQYSGIALMLIGAAIAWGKSVQATTVGALHAYAGWLVVTLAALQVLSGWLRGSKGGPTEPKIRGDHYDMTTRRRWFERVHKIGGWAAVVIAIVTVGLGLVSADAPRWMAVLLALWWLSLFVIGVRLQRAGRCVDTYQAIWGPELAHPGNQKKLTGWGVRRPLDQIGQEKV